MHAAPPPTHADARAAFAAVWGAPPPTTRAAALGRNVSTDYEVEPVALVPLGHRRFALVEKESSRSAPHAVAGAVSIAYVQRLRHGWRRLGAWHEIAWNGESGGGNLRVVVRHDLGPDPVVLVTGSHLGQGAFTQSAVVVRLGQKRPVALGRIPLGANNVGGGLPDEYDYRARVIPSHGKGFVSVTYRGWTGVRKSEDSEEPDPKTKRPYRTTIHFVLRRGCLHAAGGARTPDVDFEVERQDCTATAPRRR
jgi:hypothetical protein